MHRFNATSGRFNLNFTQDCIYLLVSPEPQSRIILHCENMQLSNCSQFKDVLTVNLNGDLRFGRNSYLYCGANAHVRTTSLRRRIAIRVRQDFNVIGDTQCTFFARKQRFYNEINVGGDTNDCGRHGRNAKVHKESNCSHFLARYNLLRTQTQEKNRESSNSLHIASFSLT